MLRQGTGGVQAGGRLAEALSVPPAHYHLTKLFAGLLGSRPGGDHNAVFVCL